MSRTTWRPRLESRTTSAHEAVRSVRSGDRVFVHGSAAAPVELVEALVARAGELEGVRLVHMHTEGPAPYASPGLERSFRHEALFIGGNVREAVQAGRADYLPVFLSDVPDLFRSGALPLDAALLNLTSPDEHGYCSLGTAIDVALAAAESARTVIALVNPAMPRSLGNAFVHVDRLAFAVPIERPPFAAQVPSASEVEQRIGAHVAHLVEDGATLQLGIGAIPNAVLARLGDRRDLGIHTEMFSDGVVDLVERGVVTTRAHVQYVVTEWGVAHLHGKSVRERSEQLTRIAHPAFRDELEAFAWNQRWR